MIHKNRKNRRHVAFREALRKMRLSEDISGEQLYDNLHQYSKNKPIMRSEHKTNISALRCIEKMSYDEKELQFSGV